MDEWESKMIKGLVVGHASRRGKNKATTSLTRLRTVLVPAQTRDRASSERIVHPSLILAAISFSSTEKTANRRRTPRRGARNIERGIRGSRPVESRETEATEAAAFPSRPNGNEKYFPTTRKTSQQR